MYYLVFTAEIVNVSLCSKHNNNLIKKKKKLRNSDNLIQL